MLSLPAENVFTRSKVEDVLMELFLKERDRCEQFYKDNPRSNFDRRFSCQIYCSAIAEAMHEFNRRK